MLQPDPDSNVEHFNVAAVYVDRIFQSCLSHDVYRALKRSGEIWEKHHRQLHVSQADTVALGCRRLQITAFVGCLSDRVSFFEAVAQYLFAFVFTVCD